MTSFSKRALAIISAIPRGSVTTYGIIATAAGNRCGARQVARLLHSSSTAHDLPWQRVVNREGRIPQRLSMGHLLQRELLEDEGIDFDSDGRIDLSRFLWLP